MPGELRDFLFDQLEIAGQVVHVFELDRMLNIGDVKAVIVDNRSDLKFAPYNARFPRAHPRFRGDCFAAIRAKDIVVHHPYESFDVVVQFLRQAARDPAVVAIKQTLYRTSADSPIVKELIAAAEAGQDGDGAGRAQGALRRGGEHPLGARPRARRRAGGLRLHRPQDPRQGLDGGRGARRSQIRTYVHFGTGNYHPITARIYTDLSFFTCDPAMGRDAARLFNYMTGYARPRRWRRSPSRR
jgi:polyphosphate kinase